MAQLSKNGLLVLNNQSFPNNTTGYITPTKLRDYNIDAIDSTVNQIVFDSASVQWNTSFAALNAFTASQQPSFNALNSFTASQLTINSGVNTFTQSASGRLNSIEITTQSINNWTASVNEIRDDGILQGYSTRFYFEGLVSASIVQNVNGPIATINIEQDGTKLNTSSFNSFTASIAGTNAFTASASNSIKLLNDFTASYGPVATGSLVANASFSGTTITYTRGNGTSFQNVGIQDTASFNSFSASIALTNVFTASISQSVNNLQTSQINLNAFTASQLGKDATLATYTGSNDTKWSTLGSLSGSFARINTGNAFTGSQIFSGSIATTGSVYGNIVSLTTVSSTASIDFTRGNFFTLTLTGPVTRIEGSNIRAGQTANLLITQTATGTGSVVFDNTFKQQSGNLYVPTTSGSAIDLLTFVTFTTSSVYVANVKNLI
jgi:hypothetical protein